MEQTTMMVLMIGPGLISLGFTFSLVAYDSVILAIADGFDWHLPAYRDCIGAWTVIMFALLILQGAGILTYACIYWSA